MTKKNTEIKVQNLDCKEMAMKLIKRHLTAIAEESMDSSVILVNNAHACAIVTADTILNTLVAIRVKNPSLYEYWNDVADLLKTEDFVNITPEEIF